jgi:hypothetical protein
MATAPHPPGSLSLVAYLSKLFVWQNLHGAGFMLYAGVKKRNPTLVNHVELATKVDNEVREEGRTAYAAGRK